jgi:multiple sugar transport system substrate-binding protein
VTNCETRGANLVHNAHLTIHHNSFVGPSYPRIQNKETRMLRKYSWLPIILLIGVLVLSACTAVAPAAKAPAGEAAATQTEVAAAPATGDCAPATDGAYAGVNPSGQKVVWWHTQTGISEENLKSLVAEFNKTNPCGITVDAQNQGKYNDIRDKVNASIAAGQQPAAMVVGYQNDQAFYQLNDTLVDLNTLIDDATWGLTAADKADFYQTFLDQSVNPLFDNQRLGFPPNRSMEVLFYNQSWLEELGFSGPPATPDEFKKMACAAAKANGDGTGGYILRDDASALASWTYAFGGDVQTKDRATYVYNSPATVKAMTFLKGMYDERCAYFFTEGYPDPQFAARKGIFAQGTTSGIHFYDIDVKKAADEAGKKPDAWGVAAIPHTTADPVQNVYGGDIMIAKTTRKATNAFFSDALKAAGPYNQGVALLPYAAYEPQMISYTAVRDAAQKAFNAIMQGADIQKTLDDLTTFANEQQKTMLAEMKK